MTDAKQDSSLGEVRSAVLSALAAFVDVVRTEAVGVAWDEPSAVRDYTVGALAGHVLAAASAIERYLDGGDRDDVQIPKGAYYAVVPSTMDAPDLHAEVRARGATLAERGRPAVIEDLVALCARLQERLALEPVTRTVVVLGGAAMALDDYLETRVIELVVHCDDLAVSVGATAAIPADAASIAVSHLLEVARQRYGDMALIRAFTRRERDAAEALRVF